MNTRQTKRQPTGGVRAPRGAGPRRPAAGGRAPERRPAAAAGGEAAPAALNPAGVGRALLTQAVQVLGEVLTFAHPADAVLSRHFRENHALGHRDRGFIAESVYGVLRRLRWLRALAGGQTTPRQLLLAWLARGEGWPQRYFDGLVSVSERDWLNGLRGHGAENISLGERADLPDWLLERLLADGDEEALLALAHSLNRPAPLDLRVNPLKMSRDELLARLRADGLQVEPGVLSPLAVRLNRKPALQKHPAFVDGSFEVQDQGSQLLAYLVQPRRGELVVDFCAGAGGKTLHLGALMRSTGRLYAFDVSERRLARLKPRMARAGLSNVHPVAIAHENDARVKRLAGKADRVLVDAPCSGLGTLRRNPDLKWRQTPESVAEMTAKQGAILAAAARLVRPGGRLVYATCSLLAEENDAVVDAFLAAHPEFREVDAGEVLARQDIPVAAGARLRLSPAEQDTDGFFAAVLERADAHA
ncbi:RsmB/NOP family class I SAM-dependent RNA methyltransferase [Pseudothauera nasutitermitis]|uniref:RsmB/NOP family class I SAM-dependent RNA methyltransferase n=1 Tax=Pseudothauera nasutitermitis TaxID=2565930 RepID=A0A4S4AQK3_9RHOO|nr:RsmB/NOP family class I SAM-dependent RNA methyltransferase [Pseudothauera nasutitermitis]THF61457.1 RsmB/NOP family class I SAM-dependent RNA methyltransferase [Pseudothauera nasutitermitis]